MSVLEKAARLIEENPFITVRELAQKLGYSEEKSIYYWLNKEGYSGIKDFKIYVLARARGSVVRDIDVPYGTNRLPLVSRFSPDGVPERGPELRAHTPRPSSKAFAYMLGSGEYSPLLLPSDILIVDPEADLDPGCLVLLWTRNDAIIRRYHRVENTDLWVHPLGTGAVSDGDIRANRARVLGLLRGF